MVSNRKLKLLMVLTILGAVCLVTGSSFAIFQQIFTSDKNQVITTGSTVITLTESASGLNLENLLVMNDSDGLAQDNYYGFTLSNTGDSKASYKLYLLDDADSISTYDGTLLDDKFVRVGLKINNNEAGPMNLEEVNRLLDKGMLDTDEVNTYQLRVWSNFEGATAEQIATSANSKIFLKLSVTGEQFLNLDESGANPPELETGMIPIYYDSTNNKWKVADKTNTDSNNQWYDYSTTNKQWANMALVKETGVNSRTYYTNQANTGQEVNMNDILAMYVWIPRFSAVIGGGTCSSITNPTIDNNPECYELYFEPVEEDIANMTAYCVNGSWLGPNSEAHCNTYIGDLITGGSALDYWGAGYTREDFIKSYESNYSDYPLENVMFQFQANATATSATIDVNNPPAINITFTDSGIKSHDAFTFDGNISGFWYGKFETSSDTTCTPANNSALESGCNLTTIMPRIKPNAENWIGAQVATYFTAYRNMETTGNEYGLVGNEVDTHMSKNNEWGAVAYLTHSIYGRCSNATTCTEIGINNKSGFITGYGAPAGTAINTNNGTYETALGMNASTTGNIYGIYDMSGGAWEYVMGNYNRVVGDNNTDNATSGFIGTNNDGTQTTGFPFPTSKYINIYTTTSAYTQSGYQHTLVETAGWTSDYNGFVSGNLPWFVCGGRYYDNESAGIFAHSNAYGNGSLYNSSRAVITP